MVRAEPATAMRYAVDRFAAEQVSLERLLLLSSGSSSLSIALCNSPSSQEALLSRIFERTSAIESGVAGEVPADYVETRERRLREIEPTALFVTGLEDESAYRQWLNRNREQWARLFAGPVIFWLNDKVASAMALGAPDFWSSRSKEAKLARLRELRGWLAELKFNWCDDSQIAGLAENWWLERLSILQDLGRMADVAADLTSLLSRSEITASFRCQLLLLRSQMHTLGARSSVAVQDLESAEVLAKRADNSRLHASVRNQIADIHEARGDLGAALGIRRDEEVRVYERLGDVRELAITRGKIAGILQARGELDEALALWQEQLPVFQKLREQPTIATVRDRIQSLELRLESSKSVVR